MPQAGSPVQISVALITRNRPDSLERCLKSVRSQNCQPFEIVVSDDSDPEFVAQTEAIAHAWGCRYVAGPHRGMQANRNQAHRHCQGTHIRTMDDDHEFPPQHFEVIQRVVEGDPASVWVFGEYLEWPTPDSVLHLPGEMQPRGFRRPVQNPDDCFAISDGATVYPRPIVTQHPFLEGLRYAGEAEYGARLKALGYRIRYCAETYIIHHTYNTPSAARLEDKAVLTSSLFIGSYLTYSCYLPNGLKKWECLAYFWWRALRDAVQKSNPGAMDSASDRFSYDRLVSRPFQLGDFWRTWRLGMEYERLFQAGQYEQMIRLQR
ncbi:MAG: glycosyltransferase family 2 protein [Leptolyngbyaceae cyanobacterium bins.59]|nr:glycosyltransferase family 2 protein [Leptolyngbyaceae cyanobacterium bins.59]